MSYVIDDSNVADHMPSGDEFHGENGGEKRIVGYVPRDWQKQPYGSLPGAVMFAPGDVYPDSEIPDRIREQEKNEASPWHVWQRSKIGVLDQDGLSYCHAFSAVDGVMIQREVQGLPYVELSAGSVGGPVTGYRNAGAMISDDMDQVVKHGVASTKFVPMQQVSRSGWQAGAEANALLHRATKYVEHQSRNCRQAISACLRGKAVMVGYDWWSHAVTIVRWCIVPSSQATITINGTPLAPEILNSWGRSYGDNGCAIIAGNRGVPDEAYHYDQIFASDA